LSFAHCSAAERLGFAAAGAVDAGAVVGAAWGAQLIKKLNNMTRAMILKTDFISHSLSGNRRMA
jgi:hypothetical protein